MKLILPENCRQAIVEHAEQSFPEECCGAMFGLDHPDQRDVLEIFRVSNTKDDNRERRYLIEPKALLLAEREAKKQGLDVVGIYHSHPNHPSQPSTFDRDHALPFWSYIIVSCMQGTCTTMQSFRLREDRSMFDEEDMTARGPWQRRPTRRSANLFVGQGEDMMPFGYSRNLSMTGIFLVTASRPAIGTVQNLSFIWGDDVCLSAARVVRYEADGIALEFVNPDQNFMHAIKEILSSSPKVELQAAYVPMEFNPTS